MEDNTEFITSYNIKFPISDMLTEEDIERIQEAAKKRSAVSWLEI